MGVNMYQLYECLKTTLKRFYIIAKQNPFSKPFEPI